MADKFGALFGQAHTHVQHVQHVHHLQHAKDRPTRVAGMGGEHCFVAVMQVPCPSTDFSCFRQLY
jgi:hypothetical protein